ncbi:uncharacterized protein LOC108676497 isoform X2 [Hyalella azteca]|uniref:Uncharacterized protein LOC108676497 isoform X2 n=1 Tax=Hyalella azteca TaxID=294128 RepID=A0A979FIP8_HYAAZ|nr:uncharacterized protein LOC108676497 isoform X2 [Hyalella azteca]
MCAYYVKYGMCVAASSPQAAGQRSMAALFRTLLGVTRSPLRKMATQKQACDIQRKLENGTYSLMLEPLVLAVDYSNQVYLHKDGLNQDFIRHLQGLDDWPEESYPTQKLKSSSFGDYEFNLGIIPSRYFESREKLDSLYSQQWQYEEPFHLDEGVETVEKISFQKALELLTMTISCNMDFYLANHEEMEKDLGRKLGNFDRDDEKLVKGLEEELFYNQVIKMIGESEDDDRATFTVMLKDFRKLLDDGNSTFATAKHGEYYLFFHHLTS